MAPIKAATIEGVVAGHGAAQAAVSAVLLPLFLLGEATAQHAFALAPDGHAVRRRAAVLVVQSLWFEPNPLTKVKSSRFTPRADVAALILRVRRGHA